MSNLIKSLSDTLERTEASIKKLQAERNELYARIEAAKALEARRSLLRDWQKVVHEFATEGYTKLDEFINTMSPETFIKECRTMEISIPRRSGKSYLARLFREQGALVLDRRQRLPSSFVLRGSRAGSIGLVVLDDTLEESVDSAVRWALDNYMYIGRDFRIISVKTAR